MPQIIVPNGCHTITLLSGDLLTLDGSVQGPKFLSLLWYGPNTCWISLADNITATIGGQNCLRLDSGVGYTHSEDAGYARPWRVTAIANGDGVLSLVWGRQF